MIIRVMFMAKILGSWSGMRKYLEQEMLADSLKGRVRYGCTTYIGMDGCRIFELNIDGKQLKRFSWETVNSYFIDSGYTTNKNPHGITEYWYEFQDLLFRYPLSQRSEYTDDEFCDALEQYRNQAILNSIKSENPLVRMFAILDRRLGRRSLMALKEDIPLQPDWLKELYALRLSAEKCDDNRFSIPAQL